MASRSIFSKNHPWVNRDFHFGSEVSKEIVSHLSCGSFGDVKMKNNVYFLFGFASRGYLDIDKKLSEANDFDEDYCYGCESGVDCAQGHSKKCQQEMERKNWQK